MTNEEREAVFEQASTPSDDEREALIEALADDENYIYNGTHMVFNEGYGANRVLAAGFRRTVTPEPSADCPQPCEHLSQHDAREGKTCPEHPCTCSEPQGEPTDAQVLAAAESLAHSAGYVPEPMVRAALRAAAAVREEGQGHG